MREKRPRFIVTYFTTAEAIATEKLCKEKGIEGRLMPAPRSLSADCGIAWCTTPENKNQTIKALTEAKIEVHGYFDMVL